MNRFFVDQSNLVGSKINISDKNDVKHLTKVLRTEVGDKYELCLSNEDVYIGVYQGMDGDLAVFEIDHKLEKSFESNVDITLFQGLPKSDKMDMIIQKCTELGVNTFCPVVMKRSVSKFNDKKSEDKKLDRWLKIAHEAAKQSKRTRLPDMLEPKTTKELVGEFSNYDLVIVPYENENSLGIKEALNKHSSAKKIGILIGPEGGFDESEIDLIEASGGVVVTLGPRILRTETAGLCATSVIQYELGDLGGKS